MRARLVILAIVVMSVTALADDAALRKAIIGTWRNGDFVVTYNADGSMHDAVPAETKWSLCECLLNLLPGPEQVRIDHVRSLSTNHLGRRTDSPLSHSDPKRTGFTDQLQYRAQSEGSYHALQSGNANSDRSTPCNGGLVQYWAKDQKIAYKTSDSPVVGYLFLEVGPRGFVW
jgi:hypothetical protein